MSEKPPTLHVSTHNKVTIDITDTKSDFVTKNPPGLVVVPEKPPTPEPTYDEQLRLLHEKIAAIEQKKTAEQVGIDLYDGGCQSQHPWSRNLNRLTTGGAMNISCFGCGKDCLASLAKPNGKS